MYKINRNLDGKEGGAIPSSLEEGLKNRFASSLIDVSSDGDGDDGGEGDEGDEGDNKNPNSSGTPPQKPENNNNNNVDDDSDTPLSYLTKAYGINVEEDDDFKDLDLSDDSIDAIKTFYDKREGKVKQEAIKELFDSAPIVKDLIEHLQNGGSISTWKEEQQVREFNLNFEEDDVDGKSDFMIEVYRQRGISEKRAKLLVEALKDDNELDLEVEKEVKAIKDSREKEVNFKKEQEQKLFLEQQKEIEETVKTVSNIVKQGKLTNGYVIPESERKEFNQFILSESLSDKYEKLNFEQRLFLDYLVFKDFKIKALESRQQPNQPNVTRVKLKSEGGGGSGGRKGDSLSLSELKVLMNK